MFSFSESTIDSSFMQYLFIAQSSVLVLLLCSLYQLNKANKKIATTEKNTRNFAASVLEHEEVLRLKFTTTLKKIILQKDNRSNKKNSEIFNELADFASEFSAFNPPTDTLFSAIEKLIQIKKTKNLTIAFYFDAGTGIIPTATEIIIYRIIDEVICNAKTHSSASKIFISLYRENNLLTISAEDNGKGFDTNKPTTGSGLQSISKAVNFLNGKIEIQSRQNKGTLLSAIIPVKS